MDTIVQQLQTLAFAEALAGDPMRAQVAAAMLELYLAGRITVTFDEQGEPTAELIEHSAPVVSSPLFVTPSLLPLTREVEEKRLIGFKTN